LTINGNQSNQKFSFLPFVTNTVDDWYQPAWTTLFGEFIAIDMVIDRQSHYQSFRKRMTTK
jgi:hypothetical protein